MLAVVLVSFTMSGCGEKTPTLSKEHTQSSQTLADQVNADLGRIQKEVEQLAAFITTLYPQAVRLSEASDQSKYKMAENGAFYKPVNDQGAALWISGAVPITEEVKAVAYFTEAADAELIRICKNFPEVVQAYYNDKNSLNRIYPWFDTLAQYPAKMNIPEYNFYYLADATHNPTKKGVWVDEPYVDPAGRGWMVSAIAPVYEGSTLQGVAGLDVTITDIVERYLKSNHPPIAVVARSGVIVAATESAIQLLEMPALNDHKYLETVKKDTFKSDEYNVLKSKIRNVRTLAQEVIGQPATGKIVEIQGKSCSVFSAPVTELGWTVLTFVTP